MTHWSTPSATRREVLAWGAAIAAVAACHRNGDRGVAPVDRNLAALPAIDAVGMMRRGELSAEDYAAALLQRCVDGSHLNAFITLEPERVLDAARAADRRLDAGETPGPLHGLPIPIKDSVNTRDYPTTGGTPALENFRPADDAKLVRLLKDAGAIVMGKTNIHELSFGWTSNNHAFGAVRNPYDTSRIPGGSSGGTAAAVAAMMAPLGVAEDTQGSIRVPAALCGICGFRPTTRRYPNDGVMPITPLFDQVGPHARTVSDLCLFDAVVTGDTQVEATPSLDGVRLGVDRDYFYTGLDDNLARICELAQAKLQDAGATLVDASIPGLAGLIELTTAPAQLYDLLPRFSEYLRTYGAGISFDRVLAQASSDIKETFARYVLPGGEHATSEEAFVAARDKHIPALRRTMQHYFRDNRLDAMLFPATMAPATPIGQDTTVEVNGEQVSLERVMSRNISPGSTAGIPGLVLPAGLTGDGLPVALEFDAVAGADRALLALGLRLEAVLGRLPPPPA